jgi:hypothetical protein
MRSDAMSFVAIATCRDLPEPDDDEVLLLEALAAAGVAAKMLAWDDEGADWDGAALTVIRSTWNYYLRPGPFLVWALRRGDRLVNSPDVVRWNHHKRYLGDLEASGVPVVPTILVERGGGDVAGLVARVREMGWTDIVVKPAISAASYRTSRLRRPPFDEAVLEASLAHGDTMVQPYVTSVETYGERSLVFIDGELTHGVRKSPRFAGDQEVVSDEATAVADDERALAALALDRARARLGSMPLYARADVVRDAQGAPMVSELELIEPSLFLRQSPAALERFARAIARLCRARA